MNMHQMVFQHGQSSIRCLMQKRHVAQVAQQTKIGVILPNHPAELSRHRARADQAPALGAAGPLTRTACVAAARQVRQTGVLSATPARGAELQRRQAEAILALWDVDRPVRRLLLLPARRVALAGVRGEVAGAVADTFCRSEDLWQSRWGR
jgi:hypothetical protein